MSSSGAPGKEPHELSSSVGVEINPAIFGGGWTIGNIGTETNDGALIPVIPFVPCDNILGARPTIVSFNGSVGPSSEVVAASAQVGFTWVETITPGEMLTLWTNFWND